MSKITYVSFQKELLLAVPEFKPIAQREKKYFEDKQNYTVLSYLRPFAVLALHSKKYAACQKGSAIY